MATRIPSRFSVSCPHFLVVNPTPHFLAYLRQQERDSRQDPQPVQRALRLLGGGSCNLWRYNIGALGSTITVLKAATCGGTMTMS